MPNHQAGEIGTVTAIEEAGEIRQVFYTPMRSQTGTEQHWAWTSDVRVLSSMPPKRADRSKPMQHLSQASVDLWRKNWLPYEFDSRPLTKHTQLDFGEVAGGIFEVLWRVLPASEDSGAASSAGAHRGAGSVRRRRAGL